MSQRISQNVTATRENNFGGTTNPRKQNLKLLPASATVSIRYLNQQFNLTLSAADFENFRMWLASRHARRELEATQ